MKILMTTDTIGGVWTFTVDLIKALKPFNVKILLASLGSEPSFYQKEEVSKIPYVEYVSSCYKLEWMEDPWEDIESAKLWITALANKFNPDLIHLNSYSFNPSIFNAPSIITGHSCVSSWWQAVKLEPLPSSWDKYAKLVKNAVQSAELVTAPSQDMLKSLIKNYGPLLKTEVIYNAGNPDSFKSNDKKEKLIFLMGRIWDEAKNIKLLMKSAPSIDAKIIIAGNNTTIDQNKIPRNVLFPGQLCREEISYWLAKSSIFVLPSLYEPFGLSALEAAYSGCALLISDIASLKEIWGDSALFLNPRNSQDLTNKLNLLLTNDSLRKQFSLKAILKSKQYHLSNMATQYFTLYNNLLKTSGLLNLKIQNHHS